MRIWWSGNNPQKERQAFPKINLHRKEYLLQQITTYRESRLKKWLRCLIIRILSLLKILPKLCKVFKIERIKWEKRIVITIDTGHHMMFSPDLCREGRRKNLSLSSTISPQKTLYNKPFSIREYTVAMMRSKSLRIP